jgi:hypothetical protein
LSAKSEIRNNIVLVVVVAAGMVVVYGYGFFYEPQPLTKPILAAIPKPKPELNYLFRISRFKPCHFEICILRFEFYLLETAGTIF